MYCVSPFHQLKGKGGNPPLKFTKFPIVHIFLPSSQRILINSQHICYLRPPHHLIQNPSLRKAQCILDTNPGPLHTLHFPCCCVSHPPTSQKKLLTRWSVWLDGKRGDRRSAKWEREDAWRQANHWIPLLPPVILLLTNEWTALPVPLHTPLLNSCSVSQHQLAH